MGMGEPLRNYASTTRAVRLLNEELGIVLTVIIAYIYHLQNIMIGIRLDNI
jgi:adenine C2-methylase RlmN of 23S rRNA A2503 and tRNA A37